MSGDLHDFRAFMKRREQAASAYITGNAVPLSEMVTHTSPATFYGPGGGYQQDAETVASRYSEDAKSFAKGGEGHFEILHMGSSDGLAYWVGYQHASAHMQGMKDPIPFNLRVTEIFRYEDGDWKLIHRHADPLAEAQKPKS